MVSLETRLILLNAEGEPLFWDPLVLNHSWRTGTHLTSLHREVKSVYVGNGPTCRTVRLP